MDKEMMLAFMAEMTKKFAEDHVQDLMVNRRSDECKELAAQYKQDSRFTEMAKTLIEEGSLEAGLDAFGEADLMSILMFFHCFEKEYDGYSFNETYVISEDAVVELVCRLAESDYEVAQETADLMGMDECEEVEDYEYDEKNYHIVGLSMEVLINYDDPEEEDEDEDSEQEDSHCCCGNKECKCGGECGSEGCECANSKNGK